MRQPHLTLRVKGSSSSDAIDALTWGIATSVALAQQIGLTETQFVQVVRQTWRTPKDPPGKRIYDDQRIN